jgi:NDP-sugar pyrophosphorylase family protein
MIDQAIILAAGRGERMMPLTAKTPKPLLKFHDKPIMDYIIEKLSLNGIKKIVVNGRHLADKIQSFLQQKQIEYPDIEFIFMQEIEESDIASAVINALPYFNNKAFFVLNGDIFWDGDNEIFQKLSLAFDKNKTTTLALAPLDNQISVIKHREYLINDNQTISSDSDKNLNMAYMGIHATNYLCMSDIPVSGNGLFLSISRKWKELELSGNLYGVVFDGKLYHLSVPQDLNTPII